MRAWVLGAVVAAAVGQAAWAGPAEDLAAADKAYDAGDYKAATPLYQKVLSAKSMADERTRAEIEMVVYFSQLFSGDADAALAGFNKMIRDEPSPDAYFGRATVHIYQQRYDEALADYNVALRLKPGVGYVLQGRARLYERTKQYDLARADWDAAVKSEPEDIEARIGRGAFLVGQGEAQEGLKDLDLAAKAAPENPEPLVGRIRAKTALGDYAGALTDANTLVGLAPDAADSYVSRGGVYSYLGRSDAALADYDRALSNGAPAVQVHMWRSVTNHQAGRFDAAVADLDKILAEGPDAYVSYVRGLANLGRGNWPAAQTDFEVAAKDPRDGKFAAVIAMSRYLARVHQDRAAGYDKRYAEPGQWPSPIEAGLAGAMTPEAVMATARDDMDRCDINYILGAAAAARGQPQGKIMLTTAVSGCPSESYELALAKSELARLK